MPNHAAAAHRAFPEKGQVPANCRAKVILVTEVPLIALPRVIGQTLSSQEIRRVNHAAPRSDR